MKDVFAIMSLVALFCEICLRVLPTKSDITVLRVIRDIVDKVHNLIPNNIVPKHDKNI